MDKTFFNSLIGQRVKVRYLDDGSTHVVKGILQEVNDTYIVVDDVVIGLGSNFISCVKQKETML
jgi:uncharacterized protein (UPF0128 family)